MKKILCAFLSFLLLILALAGCNTKEGGDVSSQSDNATAAPVPSASDEPRKTGSVPDQNEPVTMSMFAVKSSMHGPWEDMSFFKVMEEKTNVHWEFTLVPGDAYAGKKNLAFASENLPDVFFGGPLTLAEEVQYGTQGLLISLNDLIEANAPNIKELFAATEGLQKAITTDDGNIYSLFYYSGTPRGSQYCFWLNGAWLEALKIDQNQLPTTIEDLVKLLERFYEEDPNGNGEQDEIPLTGGISSIRQLILNSYGIVCNGDGIFASEDGKVSYVYTTEAFRMYLELVNSLFASKLLDQDIFTQTGEQRIANGMENKIGLVNASLPTNMYKIQSQTSDIERYPMLPALTSKQNNTPVKTRNNPINRGLFSITKVCKTPERAIQWVDELYSYEGSMMTWQGPDGYGFEYTDDKRINWKQKLPEGMSSEEFRASQTPAAGAAVPFFIYDKMLEGLSNPDEIYSNAQARKYMDDLVIPYPPVYNTEEEATRMATLKTDINTYFNEKEAEFITGRVKLDDTSWNEFVSTIDRIGANELTQIYQDAYDRYLAK